MTSNVKGADYRAALERFDQDQEERAEGAEWIKKRRRELSKKRRVAGWAGLAATLVLASVVAVPNVMAAIQQERPYVVGPAGDAEEPGLDDCVRGLWDVRRAFDDYVYRNEGKLPGRLAVLEDAPQQCPGCENTWVFRRGENGSYTIACPKPEEHGRAAVFLDHRVGPPRIRLDAGKGDEQ